MKNLILKHTKTIILVIATALFAIYTGKAQEGATDTRDQLQFGLKAGVNYSNVYDAQGDQFNADAKFGFAAGGFLSIPIGIYLGIQPEVLFSQKGFQATGRILGSTYSFTRTTNFIDVPLLIQLKPIPSLTLLGGPQFSYLIKKTDQFENIVQEQEFNNDNIRKNILCVVVGVDINPNPIVFGLRAGWDVTKNNGDGTSTTPRYKNVWYQATLGFKF
jgi:hypothetical protein